MVGEVPKLIFRGGKLVFRGTFQYMNVQYCPRCKGPVRNHFYKNGASKHIFPVAKIASGTPLRFLP